MGPMLEHLFLAVQIKTMSALKSKYLQMANIPRTSKNSTSSHHGKQYKYLKGQNPHLSSKNLLVLLKREVIKRPQSIKL